MQRTSKVLDTGLASLTKAPGALSGGEGTNCLLERVLETWAGKLAQRVSMSQRISQKKTDREREREKKKRPRDLSSDGAKVL